jgi:hypothetical protein
MISFEEMKIQLPPCFDEEIVMYEPPETQHKNLKDLLEYDPFTFPVNIQTINKIFCMY